MKQTASIVGLGLIACLLFASGELAQNGARRETVANQYSSARLTLCASGPGFRSKALMDEHYAKHGGEFGAISEADYLRLAQELRDAPPGGPVLEARRSNGEFSKFDRRHGYFSAYNRNGIIRTFFIPNNGERYFHRQAERAY